MSKSWCICSLGVFSFVLMNLQRLCLLALPRFLLHFHSFERKNIFAKIDPILRFEVLSTVVITSPTCTSVIFPYIEKIASIYEVKNTRNSLGADWGDISLVKIEDSAFLRLSWLLKAYADKTNDNKDTYLRGKLLSACDVTENAYGMPNEE